LEKSFAGDPTLAAMLTLRVRQKNRDQRDHHCHGRVKAAEQWTGSKSPFRKSRPWPTSQDSDKGIKGHGRRQRQCLADDLFSLIASESRKSGMFRETVAQKPTVPFSAGIQKLQEIFEVRESDGAA